ncbi:MAG: DUF4235 domain-containing protein [Luteolibacter sp.]
MKSSQQKSLFLVGVGLLVPMLAARLTRKAAIKSYEFITHEEAPQNPGNPAISWKEALVWAAVTGLIGGLTRVTTLRLLSDTVIPAAGDDLEDEIEDIELV